MEDKQGETSLQTIVYTYHDTAQRISAQIATMRTTRGTAVDITYSYTYDDSTWGDLLTAYNGVSRTYDQIGNPLNDGTWTYTRYADQQKTPPCLFEHGGLLYTSVIKNPDFRQEK